MSSWDKCHWVKLLTTQENPWSQAGLAEARAASLSTEAVGRIRKWAVVVKTREVHKQEHFISEKIQTLGCSIFSHDFPPIFSPLI